MIIRSLPTPIATALRGIGFVVGGLTAFVVVVVVAVFALGMTLVLVRPRPIGRIGRRLRADADARLKAAPAP